MKAKVKLGGGGRRKGGKKRCKFSDIVKAAKSDCLQTALKKAKRFLGKRKCQTPRVLNIPEWGGGFIPLIPLFSALSAIGGLAGGATSIAKTINEAKDAKARLEEMKTQSGYGTSKNRKWALLEKKTERRIRPVPEKIKRKLIKLNRPLTNIDIIGLTRFLKGFRGVYMRDSLPAVPRKNEKSVLNLDSVRGEGTHWVCFSKIDRNVVYFDPMGNLRPPKELVRYLKNCNIVYNRDRVQSNSFNCGHLCVEFLYKFE